MPSVKIVRYLEDGRISTSTFECRHIVATRTKADSYAAIKCGRRVGYEIEVIGTEEGNKTILIPGDADALFYFNAAGLMTDPYRIEKNERKPSPEEIRRYDALEAPATVAPVKLPQPPQDQPPTQPQDQSQDRPQETR